MDSTTAYDSNMDNGQDIITIAAQTASITLHNKKYDNFDIDQLMNEMFSTHSHITQLLEKELISSIDSVEKAKLLELQNHRSYIATKISKTTNQMEDYVQANTDWNTKKGKKRALETQSAEPVALRNRFNLLADENDEALSMDMEDQPEGPAPNPTSQGTQQHPSRKDQKVPAVFIPKTNIDWSTFRKDLVSQGITNFTGSLIGDNIKLQLKTATDFRIVTARLQRELIGFHTYKLNEDKTLKVVIRQIPATMKTEEIKEALVQLELPVVKVHQIQSRRQPGVLLPLFIIELTKGNSGKQIYNITEILNTKIKIQPYRKPKGPTQCHRCQRYNHSQSSCFNTPRCVKCSQEHLTKDCKVREQMDGPKCCLCGGNHTANFRGCPKYPTPPISIIPSRNQTITASRTPSNSSQTERPSTYPSSTMPNLASYSQVTQGTTCSQPPKSQNPTANSEENIFDFNSIKEIFTWIKSLNLSSTLANIKSLLAEAKLARSLPEMLEVGMKFLDIFSRFCTSL